MTSFARAIVGAALLTGLLAAPARAQEVRAGDLVITQAWARATPGGAKIGGGYVTVENKGAAPDRLIGLLRARSAEAGSNNAALASK